ncbi:MAG: hypothetical protein MSH60_07835 [Ruminococcus sp.]|nr:hypothetical protein [Ruminococcus sp.]
MAVIKNQFTMRLDPVTHFKIKHIAEHEMRSMTNMIEYLIAQEIRNYEEKHGEIEVSDEELYGE